MNRVALLLVLVLLYADPTIPFTHYAAERSCDLIGDTDVYGVGVRISFYLNWAAAYVALVLDLHEEHKGV